MDAGGREGCALRAGAGGALRGALTLGAVVRVQEEPLSNEVDGAIGLAGAVVVSGHREAQGALRAKQQQ